MAREDFEADLVNECEKDIRRAFEAGAERVSPDYAREVAFQKITNRVAGTRMAAEKLGVGTTVTA